MECAAEKREIISVWEIYSVCVFGQFSGSPVWCESPIGFLFMYTQMQLAHTLVHHRSFEGSRCVARLSLSVDLSLSLSGGPGAGHCKGQHAGDGKGQQRLLLWGCGWWGELPPLPWGRTRHVIRLIPHIGKHDLVTHTRACACRKAKWVLVVLDLWMSSMFYLKSILCVSLHCYMEKIKQKCVNKFKWHQFSKNLFTSKTHKCLRLYGHIYGRFLNFGYFWPCGHLETKHTFLIGLICPSENTHASQQDHFVIFFCRFHHISNDVLCLITFCDAIDILSDFKNGWLCWLSELAFCVSS